MSVVSSRGRWIRRAVTLGCVSVVCAAGLAGTATGATVARRWLYVEFAGRGRATALNATASGGTLRMEASWTFLYALPVVVIGTHLSPLCRYPSCKGHAYPYAIRGNGWGSVTGAGYAPDNCSAPVSASTRYPGPATTITWRVGPRSLRIGTRSPMESGLALGDQSGTCPLFGGQFAERTGEARSGAYRLTFLERHPGAVVSTPVGRASALPADGRRGRPQHVWWTGRLKVKLGGCRPTMRNLGTCFALPRGRRRRVRADGCAPTPTGARRTRRAGGRGRRARLAGCLP